MNRHCHPAYRSLIEQARERHRHGRSPLGVSPADILRARLYSYGYRGQVIGAFHATRLALAEVQAGDALAALHLEEAGRILRHLADLSMDPILPDVRALLSTLHRYDEGIDRVLEALRRVQDSGPTDRAAVVGRIADRFQASMEQVSGSNGISLTRDTGAPEQASFVVPNLGITIVPLVYGDHHSWTRAWLPGERSDVPFHQHHEGVEIHLGYGPMRGHIILGDCQAEVSEGYALPIPPRTVHGYINASAAVHHVPFIYGSLKAGGWGVFLDVEAQPRSLVELRAVSRESSEMNGTVYLERVIEEAAAREASARQIMIPAGVTDRHGVGGLELAVVRANEAGYQMPVDGFRAVSVVRGEGLVNIGGVEQIVQAHDHFGIPAGAEASLCQRGRQPFMCLDALLR
ncbi:MAG: hypothetical protein JNM56_04890 [Planctomycetia bacterium]|nr:hypothetical protein [Planctomycetia bacterium]